MPFPYTFPIVFGTGNIPASILKTLFEAHWETWDDNVPQPAFVIITDQLWYNIDANSVVFIKEESGGKTEYERDTYFYKDIIIKMILEIYTRTSLQRLYDLKKELRRIIYGWKHDISPYQFMKYDYFLELTSGEMNIWRGQIALSFESHRITLDE